LEEEFDLMVVCSLCGNEDIEKPVVYNLVIYKNGGKYRSSDVISVPFGRYCWSKKRKACLNKVDEIRKLEGGDDFF
jgi:hypothetical protein